MNKFHKVHAEYAKLDDFFIGLLCVGFPCSTPGVRL